MPPITLPAPTSLVDPDAVSLEDVLTRELEIPDYQREFAWRTNDWTHLWTDIEVLARENLGKSKDLSAHFIGPIVIADGVGRSQVIDGQQRLTALSVLLTCCLEEAERVDASLGTKWAQQVRDRLMIVKAGHPELRLLPSPGKVRDCLEYVVLQAKSRAEREARISKLPVTQQTPHGRLRNCFEYLYTSLDEYVASFPAGQQQDDAVVSLLTAVTACIVTIQVEVRDHQKVFEVFERLNARGVPLGQSDLVKNLLLSFAEKQQTRMKVDSSWGKIVAEVDAVAHATGSNWFSLGDFLQVIYASKWGKIRGSDLLSPYRALLRGTNGLPALSADQLATELLSEAKNLRELLVAPAAWPKPQQQLCVLLRTHLSNRLAFSLALGVYARSTPKSGDFYWGLWLVHAYVFRCFVLRRKSLGPYSDSIAQYARRYRYGGTSTDPMGIAVMLADKEIPISGLVDMADEMALELTTQQLTEDLRRFLPGSNKLGFYVAYMLEVGAAMVAGKSGSKAYASSTPDLQSPDTHLEHILPKNAASASQWAKLGLDRKTVKDNVGRWGNLLVLPAGVNSSIKDKGIVNKVAAYRSAKCSSLELPKTIPGGTWDLKAIAKRERLLSSTVALSAWEFRRSAP